MARKRSLEAVVFSFQVLINLMLKAFLSEILEIFNCSGGVVSARRKGLFLDFLMIARQFRDVLIHGWC